MGKYILYINLFFFLCVNNTSAQPELFPNLVFKNFTVKDGLSTNTTTCVFEDSEGIIWIGTRDGLNRYDPTGFKIYKHNVADTTTISDNWIANIQQDKDYRLWIGTVGGLCSFNTKTGKAKRYTGSSENKNAWGGGYISEILLDNKKRLWIATADKGALMFDIEKETFTAYKTPEITDPARKDLYNRFGRVFQDKQGRIWFASPFGMYLADEKNKELILFDQGTNTHINGIYDSGEGYFYLGEWGGGLLKFYPEQKRYEKVISKMFNSNSPIISSVIKWTDNAGNDWLCLGTNPGFALMNMKTGQIKEYTTDKDNPYSFIGNHTARMMIDRQNRLWMANEFGVSVIDPYMQNFQILPIYLQRNLIRPDDFNVISTLAKDGKNYYITSWYAGGVYTLDNLWKITSHFHYVPNKNNINYSVNSMHVDKRGDKWYCTDSGLVKQDGNNYKYFFPENAKYYPNGDFVFSNIIEDEKDLFWIRSRRNGLYKFDPVKQSVINIYKPDSSSVFYAIYQDSQKRFWLSCNKGFFMYNAEKDTFENIPIDGMTKNEVEKIIISDIEESPVSKQLWAVYNAGLLRFDEKNKMLFIEKDENEILNNYNYELKIDSTGIVWISCQTGLLRYNPDTKSVSTYNYSSGLPFLFENWGFLDYDYEGNLLQSNAGVITKFNPKQFKINDTKPTVIVLDFLANNQPIDVSGKIVLRRKMNTVNIHFASNNYTSVNENKYYFKIKGDENWQQVNDGNIFFGNLSPGIYNLVFKTSNNENIFSEEKHLSFRILPYWYETNIFKLLILLSLLFIAYKLIRMRMNNIRKNAETKQRISMLETVAMRAQMNPHFIFNCLNSIELYAAENNSEATTYYLSRFSRLIRLVLDNSKSETITLDQEIETLTLYIEMEKMRFKEKLNYEINIDDNLDTAFIEIPSMLLQPYVENAIWHGLMHKEQGGKITINIFAEKEDLLTVIIEDNGIGRAKAAELKSKSATKKKSYGMQITSDRIEALNKRYKMDTQIIIEDLYDDKNIPSGTRVTLNIFI